MFFNMICIFKFVVIVVMFCFIMLVLIILIFLNVNFVFMLGWFLLLLIWFNWKKKVDIIFFVLGVIGKEVNFLDFILSVVLKLMVIVCIVVFKIVFGVGNKFLVFLRSICGVIVIVCVMEGLLIFLLGILKFFLF